PHFEEVTLRLGFLSSTLPGLRLIPPFAEHSGRRYGIQFLRRRPPAYQLGKDRGDGFYLAVGGRSFRATTVPDRDMIAHRLAQLADQLNGLLAGHAAPGHEPYSFGKTGTWKAALRRYSIVEPPRNGLGGFKRAAAAGPGHAQTERTRQAATTLSSLESRPA